MSEGRRGVRYVYEGKGIFLKSQEDDGGFSSSIVDINELPDDPAVLKEILRSVSSDVDGLRSRVNEAVEKVRKLSSSNPEMSA